MTASEDITMHSPAARGEGPAGVPPRPGVALPKARRDEWDSNIRRPRFLLRLALEMTWWERWTFNLLHGFVAVTGIVYFWMKYAMVPTDPFAVVNHPWQPSMLAWHIVAAPFFVVFFGMLFRTHTLRKLLSASRRNRRSGWTSLVSFSVMALTGYLIQVASSPAWITASIWAHVVASVVFVAGYTTHMVIGWRLGRESLLGPGTFRPAARPSP